MKCFYYFFVFVGIYEWVYCVIVIVIEFDKFKEMSYFWGVWEILWVVGCYDSDNKEW